MTPDLVLHDLTVGYDRHPAVHHLSGRFCGGSLTAVVGPNGSGKSTLLKALAGVLRPLGGDLDLGGLDPRCLAYLPQLAEIDRSFPLRVLDMVSLGHWRGRGAWGGLGARHREQSLGALARVGLAGFERRLMGELSAGQFQRVLFARMMLQEAPVILLDEPFTALDARTTSVLLGVVAHWQAQGRTVVAVIHDLEQVRAHFPQTLLLAREALAWGPTPQVMTPANLTGLRAMTEAWDEDAALCGRGQA